MRNKEKVQITYLLLLLVLLCTGCGPKPPVTPAPGTEAATPSPWQDEFVVPGPNSYDSTDTAVLIGRDDEAGTLTFLNLEKNRTYTLSVDGTTTIFDKYGEAMALKQIADGEIVDITFLRTKKRLNSMSISQEAFCLQNVSKYEINPTRKDITIGTDIYQFTEQTTFLSDGKRVSLMDLNPVDILTFHGIGTTILSIEVVQGHGYLRLERDQQFVGGFIEVSPSMIYLITEDMLLTVPEGNYDIRISHPRGGGEKSAVIHRNRETVVDLGDLELEEIKMGTVLFTMNPSKAILYVDGTKVDTSAAISLEYGIHQIIARAEGYETLTSYIKVASENGGIEVTLDPSDNKEKEDQTSGYKVYIDSPVDTEVYLDGNYVGIAPVSFTKTSGSHSITLRKSGYETRNYTINIDTEAKDVNYSFAELEKSTEKTPDVTPKPTASEEQESASKMPGEELAAPPVGDNDKPSESTENTED